MKLLGMLSSVPRRLWKWGAIITVAAGGLAYFSSTLQQAAVDAWRGEQLREELQRSEQELQRQREELQRVERLASERERRLRQERERTERAHQDLAELEERYEEVQAWGRQHLPGPVADWLRDDGTRTGDPDGN